MIENEDQLRHSIQSLAKMYGLRDRIAAQTVGDPETRDAEVDGVESMIRKIERQVAEYLVAKYAARHSANVVEQEIAAQEKVAA